MIQHLKSITFNFDDTRKLSEERHKEAFIEIFVQVMHCLKIWFENMSECFVCCDSEVALPDGELKISGDGKAFCYRISAEQLFSSPELFATAIYVSNNDRIAINLSDCGSQRGFDIEVAMDPIYIGITKADSHSFDDNFLP